MLLSRAGPSPSALATLMMDSNATNSSGANVVIMCPNAGFSMKNETSYFGQYLDVVVAYDVKKCCQ